MDEVSIVKAWALWLSGNLPPNAMLWGISIFWWGRFGKMMQLVGAITILADIIGPERIRGFGASLQSTITSIVLIQYLKDCFGWYVVIFRQTLMKEYDDETTSIESSRPRQLDILNYVISFVLTSFLVLSIDPQQAGWIVLVEAAIIFTCLLVSISPIITVLTIVVLILLGLLINSAFVKPLAWTLENPSLDRFTKIASLFLLLIGFHFELLAS